MRTIAVILIAALLAGCSMSTAEPEPVSIGPGYNEHKRSPCACMLIPNAPLAV